MKPIITCDLPLPIQRLYIKRLKHMIWRWEFENFCGHCPIGKSFREHAGVTKRFIKYCSFYYRPIVNFVNVNLRTHDGCPCHDLKPKQALKRAKDFIERFEAGEGANT